MNRCPIKFPLLLSLSALVCVSISTSGSLSLFEEKNLNVWLKTLNGKEEALESFEIVIENLSQLVKRLRRNPFYIIYIYMYMIRSCVNFKVD